MNALHDFRLALRRLRSNPVLSVTAVASLALGIGANSAIFSVLRAVVLAPLPYGDDTEIVAVHNAWKGDDRAALSQPEVFEYRAGVPALASLTAYYSSAFNVTGSADAERVQGTVATAEVLRTLRVEVVRGRGFRPEDDQPGAAPVLLLGHALWQQRYGGDPELVGREIVVNGRSQTVIGILPPSFRMPHEFAAAQGSQIVQPFVMDPARLQPRSEHYISAVGRLAPGETVERVGVQLRAVAQGWAAQGLMPPNAEFTPYALTLRDDVLGATRPLVLVLAGAVAFVLLIACANVANLLLAAAEVRRREMAVRASLGAGTRRLLAQLLTESVVLALIGAAAGLLVALLAVTAIRAFAPQDIPRVADIRLDFVVMLFALGAGVVAGIASGLAPAWQLVHTQLASVMREGGRGASASRRAQRARRTLAGAELALSVVLLVGAGLMIRSFNHLTRIDLGYDPAGVLTFDLAPPVTEYPDDAQVSDFYSRLLQRIRSIPGVETAGGARALPLASQTSDASIFIPGRDAHGENLQIDWQVVTPGYLESMRIPLVAGRYLDERDRAGGMPAAVINQTMAERLWPGESAVGKQFQQRSFLNPPWTIVGVVEDVRHNSAAEEPRVEMYMTQAQYPEVVGFGVRTLTIAVRTQVAPEAVTAEVRQAVRDVDARVPVANMQTMSDVVQRSLSSPRFTALLLTAFAVVALALAAVGIYGVIAYGVTQRTAEIGVRMALGAGVRDVLWLVFSGGLAITAAGIGIGVLGAALLSRTLQGMVYGVGTLDPATFAAVPALLLAVALLACLVPAWRAARVSPLISLRSD